MGDRIGDCHQPRNNQGCRESCQKMRNEQKIVLGDAYLALSHTHTHSSILPMEQGLLRKWVSEKCLGSLESAISVVILPPSGNSWQSR